MIEESNGNGLLAGMSSGGNPSMVSSQSIDDLSQSLSISEYTDADESMSAPTEFLAEFLSAVMLKDYRKALRYCKLSKFNTFISITRNKYSNICIILHSIRIRAEQYHCKGILPAHYGEAQ